MYQEPKLPDQLSSPSKSASLSDVELVSAVLTGGEPAEPLAMLHVSDIETRFLAAIAAIAQIVILGYNLVGQPNDPVPTALNKALGVLDAVQGRIAQLTGQLNSLLAEIDKLESRIKGHVDEAFLRDSLAYVSAKTHILAPLLKDEVTIKAELPRVLTNMDELLTHLERVRVHSQGLFTGALNMSPGIALWVQTFVAVERARGTHLTRTVWDQPFHTANMVMLNGLFQIHDQMAPGMQAELDAIPKPGFVYERTTAPSEAFVATSVPYKSSYLPADGREGLYSFDRAPFGGSILDRDGLFQLVRRSLPTDHWEWRFAEWLPVTALDPEVEKARLLIGKLRRRRAEIRHHFRLMNNAPYYRDQLRAYCEKKPVEWGGTAPTPIVALVHLVNGTWPSVTVEVRRGREATCDLNAAFETRLLQQSETWAVPAPDVDVCYRRDLDPAHPNGQWTNWRRIAVNAGSGEYWESVT